MTLSLYCVSQWRTITPHAIFAGMSEKPPLERGNERDEAAYFGFAPISLADRTPRVRSVFQKVASRYDVMNDLMSGGVHRLWKAAMIDWLHPRPGMRLLDVAGGTGDIAIRFLERLHGQDAGSVVVCDLTFDMLAIGRDRAIDRGILSAIQWVCANAEQLPIPDRSVDAYSIAFGLRNVTRLDLCLLEARRVLKPGGRFLSLEFSQVALPFLSNLYDLYSFRIVPVMGMVVTGNREAYQYLVESIRRFPAQSELAGKIEAAGFSQVSYRNLSGGIAALHSAWRL